MPSPRRIPITARRGFALLITITLLAFLVLLLVGLSSFTRVETQVVSNSQQLVQARSNALLALNIALGQLQEYAGPDQRTTGTADLTQSTAGTGARVATGAVTGVASSVNGVVKGLPRRVYAGNRYWTGAWGNSDPSTPVAGNQNIYEHTPDPVLLNWLVSGNEGAFAPVATTASGNTTVGQVTGFNGGNGSTAPAFTPQYAIVDTTTGGNISVASSPADVFTVTPANPTAVANLSNAGNSTILGVLLVGNATAGNTPRTLPDGTSEPAADRYVVAPLVGITPAAGLIPGVSTAATLGHYAWWVGDEGEKARVNLADPYAAHTDATSDALAQYRLMTAPRTGLEVVGNSSAATGTTDSGFVSSAYEADSQPASSTATTVARVITRPQLQQLDSSITAAIASPRFHDITPYSFGLEVDSYNGGLRHDLTYELEQSTFGTWTNTQGSAAGAGLGLLPAAYSPVMGTLTTTDKRVPKWDLLSSFYNLPNQTQNPSNSLAGTSTDYLEIRPATATQAGILPVVVQMRLLIGIALNSSSNPDTSTTPSLPANTARLLFSPLVVIANPYTVTLKASNGIQFRFYNDTRIYGANQIGLRNTTSTAPFPCKIFGGLSNATFQIPGPVTLSPGQVAVFYVTGGATNIGSAAGTPVPMVQMTGTPPDLTNYAYVNYGNYSSNPTGNDTIIATETYNNSTFITEFSLGTPGNAQTLLLLGGIDPDRTGGIYSAMGRSIPTTGGGNNALFLYEWKYTTPADNASDAYGSSANLGVVNTTMRGLADCNPRASYYRVTNQSISSPPFVQFYNANTGSTALVLQDFQTNLITPYWARATTTDNGNAITKGLFFDVPRRASGSAIPPVASLAAFQHADLAAEDIPTGSAFPAEFGTNTTATLLSPNPGHQPAYIVGNSYATPFVARNEAVQSRDDLWSVGTSEAPDVTTARNYYDMSYLLNTALWDGCFLSTIPQSGAAYTPENPRLSLVGTSGLTTTAAAAAVRSGAAANYVAINGAFNVNSTSEEAWAAVLAGMKNLPYIPGLATPSGTNSATVFPRSLWQTAAASTSGLATGTGTDSYSGYRQLTDAQIRTLAAAIVAQVRLRGPFVSLAQFVNRALVAAANSTTGGLGQSGALQSAIDAAGLNALSGWNTTQDQVYVSNSLNSATNTSATIVGDGSAISDHEGQQGASSNYADGLLANLPNGMMRSTAIPGWLTQADVLQAIGPVLSARSDTFVIRTYGDVQNPVTGAVTSRAWCEAVVQRVPGYVDPSDASTVLPASLTSTLNKTFGRRFKIISFRWLTPSDI